MAHQNDSEMIAKKRNTARFFTENRHIAWVLLVATILWGMFGFWTMPKRKDPDVPIRAAVALASWPGATAENVEDRVTRVVEHTLSENSKIEKLESTTRAGGAVITITLDESVQNTAQELDDIGLKLSSIGGLPSGASLQFIKDFGDTSALMLTVASPRSGEAEVQLRAEQIARAIRGARADSAEAEPAGAPATLVACFPFSLDARELTGVARDLAAWAERRGARNVRLLSGPGFFAIDSRTLASDTKILDHAEEFLAERLRAAELHPDLWPLALIRDPSETEARLSEVRGEKYSYRELDTFTDDLAKALQAVPEVAKVTRAGVLSDVVYLEYSQERLTAYDVSPGQIQDALAARNVVARGGAMELRGKTVLIAPAGEFQDQEEIGEVIVSRGKNGAPVYLRDLASIGRGYESAQYLAFSSWRDASGAWQRTRNITLSITYSGQNPEAKVPLRQIADFDFSGSTAKILRRNHARTITIGGFPREGVLPSEVIAKLGPELESLQRELPPGYQLAIGGEQEEQVESFNDLVVVLVISILGIFIALVLQFRNALEPLVVFAAIPFGVVASLLSLRVMGAPFGFMAFLGVISLIGVIVSHVIVLFDFIEEQHEHGAPLLDALLDAGILRLRPVLVTVGATVLGLVPLAMHGGPLWEPLCYVQIGGLTAATVVTLVIVPVLYAIFVLDLKLIRWDAPHGNEPPQLASDTTRPDAPSPVAA